MASVVGVRDLEYLQVPIHHRFGQRRWPAAVFGQLANLGSQIAAHFFVGVTKHKVLIHEDRAGVAHESVIGHDHFIAS